MLAIGKSAWSAKESKYIGVHCPLAITQGRISESLLSSCREAKKDLPNKKSIGCWILIASIPHGTEMLMFCCVTHLFVFFWGEQFFESMGLSAGSHFFSQDMKVLDELSASALQATAGGSSVEVPYPWYMMIYAYIYIYMYNIQWEFQDPKMEVR